MSPPAAIRVGMRALPEPFPFDEDVLDAYGEAAIASFGGRLSLAAGYSAEESPRPTK